jgi:predicted permease
MQDLRLAFRGLRRDPTYASAVVMTLALTLGATTAMFSVVNGILLKPLAYREAHQLVVVREVVPPLAHLYPSLPANPRHFDVWRTGATTFAAMAELQPATLALTNLGEPREVSAVRTTAGLFSTLNLQPALGRTLQTSDELSGIADVVIVTDAFWRQQLGADPLAVGRALTLDGRPHTIVGILSPDFRLPEHLGTLTASLTHVDVLVPLRLNLTEFSQLGDFNYIVLGRLRWNASVEHATAELNALDATIELPPTVRTVKLTAQVVPLLDTVVGGSRRALWLLVAATAAVLLIACANLANLSLTRAIGRTRDAAIQVALGASRSRLIRSVVLEQVLLSISGGAAGLVVARTALFAFVRTAPIDLPRIDEVALDGRVLACAAALSIGAGLLVALLPAWRIGGRDTEAALRAGSHAIATDRGGSRARNMLVALQVGLSVTLLVITTLLTTSFLRLLHANPAFVATNLLTMRVTFPPNRYGNEREYNTTARVQLYERLLDAAAGVPGVERATWTSKLPLEGEDWVDVVAPVGETRPFTEQLIANYRFVAPGFFRTLLIPVQRGRAMTASDRDSSIVPALVSETTAARVWPGVDALGQQFHRGNPDEKPLQVIGIVPDGRMTRLDGPPPPMVYVPYWYRTRLSASIAIRTRIDPMAVAGSVRQAVWAIDRDIVIADVQPMTEVTAKALRVPRYGTTLFVTFGAVALSIAIVGIYAVTAYGLVRRRREMNIRVALGARVVQVRALLLRQSARPVIAGLLGGIFGALGLGNVVASFLVDVRGRDPLVMATVVIAVGLTATLSMVAAIGQGLSINPASALREE